MTELAADVVVIGGGGAGLAAAIEARSLGRSVVLLEKNPRKRPHSAEDLRRVLATMHVPDAAPPPVGPAPEAREAKRLMPPSIAPREYRPRPDVGR